MGRKSAEKALVSLVLKKLVHCPDIYVADTNYVNESFPKKHNFRWLEYIIYIVMGTGERADWLYIFGLG